MTRIFELEIRGLTFHKLKRQETTFLVPLMVDLEWKKSFWSNCHQSKAGEVGRTYNFREKEHASTFKALNDSKFMLT